MPDVKLVKTQEEFDQAIKDAASTLVVVDFYADWCGPCKMIAPKIKEWAAGEYSGVIFLKVDVDDNNDTAEANEISAMPTFLLFKNGEKVETVVGAGEQKLKAAIEKFK